MERDLPPAGGLSEHASLMGDFYLFLCVLPLLVPAAIFGFAMIVLLDQRRGIVRCGVAVLYAAAFAAAYCFFLHGGVAADGLPPDQLMSLVGALIAMSGVAVAVVNVTWTIPTLYRLVRKNWRMWKAVRATA
jgi:hypothetical protein